VPIETIWVCSRDGGRIGRFVESSRMRSGGARLVKAVVVNNRRRNRVALLGVATPVDELLVVRSPRSGARCC